MPAAMVTLSKRFVHDSNQFCVAPELTPRVYPPAYRKNPACIWR